MSKALKNRLDVRVRFNETDPLGIVWHGNYITYFEEGREAFGREHGLTYLQTQAQGFVTPIVETNTKHLLPLKYGDTFTIETTYVDTPAAKLIYEYKIFNSEDKLVCEGRSVQVFLDEDGNLSLTYPAFFEAWKKKVGLEY